MLIPFLQALHKMDRALILPRDVLAMEAVRENPGTMGRTLALKLGYATRSMVQGSIRRMVDAKMIEDRRHRSDNRTPNALYISPAGEKFLNEMLPTHDL